MAMDGNARGDVDYTAVFAANPNSGKLTPGEANTMKHYFEILFTADTGYITGNADVLPDALSGPNLNNPIGQPLQVPGLGLLDGNNNPVTGIAATGTTSAPEDIQGKGSIV